MIWKNCSSHEVVEFNTGWSMHHHQSCTKLLQSIFYEFVERHLRKADILQMTTSVNSVNWKFKPPPSSPAITSQAQGRTHFSSENHPPWSSVSAATGATSSLEFARGTHRNGGRDCSLPWPEQENLRESSGSSKGWLQHGRHRRLQE